MNWRQIYAAAHRQWQDHTAPNMVKDHGYLPTQYPREATANGKNSIIINFLTWEGYMADRTNSMGIPVKKTAEKFNIFTRKLDKIEIGTTWRRQNSRKGRCDITAIIDGIYHGFETKTPNDRLSVDQKGFHASIRSAGGVALVIGPIEDFFSWYQDRKVSLTNGSPR